MAMWGGAQPGDFFPQEKLTAAEEYVWRTTDQMKTVMQLAAAIIVFGNVVGCATSSYKPSERSTGEVLAAMAHAEQAALTRLKASSSTEVAEAACMIEREIVADSGSSAPDSRSERHF
jgi:hypothetical protein